ncbi:glucans biosynthesis glucosyltransferase MdoH [Limobrevibacterium gyesilva]|nr:glucans biosynthesis glucosyltransferase MdoH [Limobrevibacterium gyesilva]
MLVRRLIFFAILLLTTIGLTALMWSVLAPGGWTVAKALLLACFIGVAPWLGVCLGNALPGFLILVLARHPARTVLPVDGDIDSAPITARTALAVTIRNEDMALVLPPLRRLLEGLADSDRFALFILSDTQDPALVAAEEAAIAAFPLPVRYRRRAANTGFKAGNVMDFLDHHAVGFDFVLTLDADSEMTPAAVRCLVRIMQAAPRMGIVQHLTAGRPAASAFPRLFQFGMRAGMRVWSIGQGWWQDDAGPYWGHNAILRIAPFRAHCRLQPLPDGSPILSHDQVEAARLRAAGWGVCVWADDDGSLEANPPALPEFLHRDARWLAGNLQYRHLLVMPGLRPMGRWQLMQAILLFAGAPLYNAMLALAAIAAATGDTADFPRGRLLALALAWTLILYAPKLLGYAETLIFRARSARYGGRARFAAGAAAEFAFTLLLDALSYPTKTLAMLRLALGARPGWLPQNRSDRGVGWAEAARMFWPHTLFGTAVFALLAWSSWPMALWALPFAGGLLVSVPFCVATSDPRLSAWLRRRRIAATPEELAGNQPCNGPPTYSTP